MKTCELLVSEGSKQIVAGRVFLSSGKISHSAKKGYEELVLMVAARPIFEKGSSRRVTAEKNPEAWFTALPAGYSGSYLRARIADGEGVRKEFDPAQPRDPDGKWTTGGMQGVLDLPIPEGGWRPVQTAESNLSSSKILSSTDLGGGMNSTTLVELDTGEQAVFKVENVGAGVIRTNIEPGYDAEREAGAWEVAKIVGMDDLVVPTVIREIDGENGSLSLFVDGLVAKDARLTEQYDGPEGLARAAMFDFVIGNEDRHKGNWLVTTEDSGETRLRLIDHGLSFPDQGRYGTAGGNHRIFSKARKEFDLEDRNHFQKYSEPYTKALESIKGALRSTGVPDEGIRGVEERIRHISLDTVTWENIL